MSIERTFVINQAVPFDYGRGAFGYASRFVYAGSREAPPSRFRRKKGYDGPTACHFNKNYRRMPKDF